MKPIRPPTTEDADQDYRIDALIREGTVLSDDMQLTLRNLLVACELGALVVVQCTRIEDDKDAFILCAYAETKAGEERILPICVLDAVRDISLAHRPPPYTKRKGSAKFARTKFTEKCVEPVAVEDGVVVVADVSRGEDDSVH